MGPGRLTAGRGARTFGRGEPGDALSHEREGRSEGLALEDSSTAGLFRARRRSRPCDEPSPGFFDALAARVEQTRRACAQRRLRKRRVPLRPRRASRAVRRRADRREFPPRVRALRRGEWLRQDQAIARPPPDDPLQRLRGDARRLPLRGRRREARRSRTRRRSRRDRVRLLEHRPLFVCVARHCRSADAIPATGRRTEKGRPKAAPLERLSLRANAIHPSDPSGRVAQPRQRKSERD